MCISGFQKSYGIVYTLNRTEWDGCDIIHLIYIPFGYIVLPEHVMVHSKIEFVASQKQIVSCKSTFSNTWNEMQKIIPVVPGFKLTHTQHK